MTAPADPSASKPAAAEAGAPVEQKPAAASAPSTPARDWEAEIKAAQARAEKAEKQAKTFEGKLGELETFKQNLAKALGGDKPDPAAEVGTLRSLTERFQGLAKQNAIEAAVVRVAAKEGALDPDDVVRLVGASLEWDPEAGRVKDADSVAAAVSALKKSKPYLFTPPPAPADKAAPLPPARAPTTPQPAPQPAQRFAPSLQRKSLAELRAEAKAFEEQKNSTQH